MGLFTNHTGAMHPIKAKLYSNYLSNVKGAFIARTEDEALLSIEKVCDTMKDRGGFTGNYDDLVEHIKQFLDETAYLLCNGFSVNLKYFTVHPRIKGTFASVNEAFNPKKHSLGFKFRVGLLLRNLAKSIEVVILGKADSNAYIDEFTDTDEELVNSNYYPGDLFCLTGSKIKIQGDSLDIGIFFVPVDDPSKAVKVGRIAENNPSKIIGIAPYTGFKKNRIEVRTQYTGSSAILKTPRIIVSNFVLETA